MLEKKALHETINYEEKFEIRILCIANNELKLFNLGNVFKQFQNLLRACHLQLTEFQKHIFSISTWHISHTIHIC